MTFDQRIREANEKAADKIQIERRDAVIKQLVEALRKVEQHFGDPGKGEIFGIRAALSAAETLERE